MQRHEREREKRVSEALVERMRSIVYFFTSLYLYLQRQISRNKGFPFRSHLFIHITRYLYVFNQKSC